MSRQRRNLGAINYCELTQQEYDVVSNLLAKCRKLPERERGPFLESTIIEFGPDEEATACQPQPTP